MENTKFYVTAEELSEAYGICLSKAYFALDAYRQIVNCARVREVRKEMAGGEVRERKR